METPGIIEAISSILILIGVMAMVIAAVGIIRLPDFYTRNSASTKAVTLGIGLILLGISVYFNDLVIALKLLSIIFFIVLTNPIAAYVISRSAYKDNIPFYKETDLSDFEEMMAQENKEHGDRTTEDEKKGR